MSYYREYPSDFRKRELLEKIYNEQNFHEWIDKETGYRCRIIRPYDRSHLCGYVKLPDNYSRDWVGYDEIPVEIHGGVTFFGELSDVKDEIWIGFDCAHLGDLSPQDLLTYKDGPLWKDDVYRDLEYVKKECISLAKQLKDLEGC